MTLNNIMGNDGANQVGWLSLIIGFFGSIWNWVLQHGNETIVIISGILGIIFLFLKIRISRIELKLKKEELKRLDALDEEAEQKDNKNDSK
jgi:hypothetical protein